MPSLNGIIRITTNNGEQIEGNIVKISSSMVAIKKDDGILVFEKDDNIKDIVINPNKNTQDRNTDLHEKEQIHIPPIEKAEDLNVNIQRGGADDHEKESIAEQGNTLGEYENDWDPIDKDELLSLANKIKVYLSRAIGSTIVSANANVKEVFKRSFLVYTKEHPKLSVSSKTIIERGLYSEIEKFSIGETLPVVIYFHNMIYSDYVFLSLAPNTLGGYVDLLYDAIKENHYEQAKSLCYFLLSQINDKRERGFLFALLKVLKPVNAFSKMQKLRISSSPRSLRKIPKDYKEIETQLNQFVSEGNHEDAILLIDKILQNQDIEKKYKSSLLLRKAQVYSSMTEYDKARSAYLDLVQYRERIGGEPNYLSHLYTELARLQAMDKAGLDDAKKSVQRALSVNPQNKYALTLLEHINDGSLSFVSISSNTELPEQDKELLLDSDESAMVISTMIDIDIREHHFTNEQIINNGGVPTASIARSIYEEAKMTKDVDLYERYPVYLEAAKAFSELPVGSYDTQDYLESIKLIEKKTKKKGNRK